MLDGSGIVGTAAVLLATGGDVHSVAAGRTADPVVTSTWRHAVWRKWWRHLRAFWAGIRPTHR